MTKKKLTKGEDYTMEDGLMVLTAKYLLERGYCCENGCRNCPYKNPDTNQSIQNSFEDHVTNIKDNQGIF